MTATVSACQIKRNNFLNLQGRLKILFFLFFTNIGIISEGKINSCAAFVTVKKKNPKMCPVFRKDKTQENLLKGTMLYHCRHGAADLAGLFHLLFLWLCEKWYKGIIKSNTYSLRHRETEINNKITQFCLLGNGNCVLLKTSGRKKRDFWPMLKEKPLCVNPVGHDFHKCRTLKTPLEVNRSCKCSALLKIKPLGSWWRTKSKELVRQINWLSKFVELPSSSHLNVFLTPSSASEW